MLGWRLVEAENVRNSLTKEQENEISKLYRNVYLRTRKQMMAIPKDGTVSQKLQRQYLNKLIKQLDEAYKSLGTGLEKELKKNAEKAAQGVVDDVNSTMSRAGLSLEGAYSYVAKDVVESIATGKVYGGNWSLSKAIWSDINKHQGDINRIVAEGAAANLSAYEIAKSLEQYVDPKAKKPWDWGKVYPGTSRKVDYNAQRLARTMISHAYQQSLERVCKNNPFAESYTWKAAQNERTCPICMERNGQVYEKGKLPLDHPNGRCTFLVNMPSMDDVAERLGDWANGGADPELDTWIVDMAGIPQEKQKPANKETANKKEPAPKKEQATKKEKPLTEKQKAKAKEWDEAYKNVIDFAKKTGQDPAQTVKNILGKPPKGSIHYTTSSITKAEKAVQSAKSSIKKSQQKAPVTQKPTNTRGHLSEMTDIQRVKQVMKDLKCTESEAKSICNSVMQYSTTTFIDVKQYQRDGTTGGNLSVKEAKKQAEDIEKYIKDAPKYNGTVYRGMNVDTKTGEAFVRAAKEGKLMDMGGCISSWTSLKSHAEEMNEYGANEFNLIFTVKGSTKGTSITHLQEWSDEKEVLMGKDVVWKPVDVVKKGANSYEIKLEELK